MRRSGQVERRWLRASWWQVNQGLQVKREGKRSARQRASRFWGCIMRQLSAARVTMRTSTIWPFAGAIYTLDREQYVYSVKDNV
eukprot:5909604-Prymnesium_polylepis.1